MSTAPKAAAFAVLLRVTFTGFPQLQHRWTALMWILAVLSMTAGNLGALLAFFLLSLIGIPFTGGFFGKFYVFSAAIHGGHVWLAVVGLLNSGVACFYYLRLLTAVYSRPATDQPDLYRRRPTSVAAAIGLALAAIAVLFLGILS